MSEKKSDKNLEGEGSYEGAARYDREAREFGQTEDVEQLGKKALEERERDEPAFRKAEEEGKKHAAEEDPELYRKGERK